MSSSKQRHSKIDRRRSDMTTSPASMKRRRSFLSLSTSAVLLSTAHAQDGKNQEHFCPAELKGWAPSADCTKYYWCSGGQLASVPYDCVRGTLFDAVQLTCLPAVEVDCKNAPATTATPTSDAPLPSSKGSESQNENIAKQMSGNLKATPTPTSKPTTRSPTVHPTPRDTYIGDAIYFADFPSRSCRTGHHPAWIQPDELFQTKAECCATAMNWIPLEACLGHGWVETNYFFVPTKSPSESPTDSPSMGPSKSPSFTPTAMPTDGPTFTPTTSDPTMMPSMVRDALCRL